MFLAVLGGSLLMREFSSGPGKRGSCLVAVQGLFIAVVSHVAEHRPALEPGQLSSCSSASRAQAQELWLRGLVAPWTVGSSRIRDLMGVSCTGKQIL